MNSKLIVYDLDYFIAKFKTIPDKKFCVNYFFSITEYQLFGFTIYSKITARCAQGHCVPKELIDFVLDKREGFTISEVADYIPEWAALLEITGGCMANGDPLIALINNGHIPEYQQSTPKARILAFLDDLKIVEEMELEEGHIPITKMLVERFI